MEFSVNNTQGVVNVTLAGQLTYVDAPQFDSILSHLDSSGVSGAQFDVGNLDFIDSTGMSLFVHAYDASKAHGFTVTISGAKDKVRAALTKAGFDNLVTVS